MSLLAPDLGALVDNLLAEHPVSSTSDHDLRTARFDAGLAFPHFRIGLGGLGLDVASYRDIEQRFLAAGAIDWSDRNVIGIGMAAPTLHTHGTGAQQELLRPLFVGVDIWCQLFSEPGAGSDLANLSTRAEREGDGWVINGQKVWTTLAHEARWGLLLARSNPDAPKHAGLTYFVVDMHSDAIEVRPLRQLTGEAEFNECYFNDLYLGPEAIVGAAGDGWRVAMTTLANERLSLGTSSGAESDRPIDVAIRTYKEAFTSGRATATSRDQLARLWIATEVGRMNNERALRAKDGEPGPEGSVNKLALAELNKSTYELVVNMSGPMGMLIDNYDSIRPTSAHVHGGAVPGKAFLRTRANSIEGGTSEIMRTILGERVLGLPPEPRVEKGIPWNQSTRV